MKQKQQQQKQNKLNKLSKKQCNRERKTLAKAAQEDQVIRLCCLLL